MKTKLVLWGTKGTDENQSKVLIALELNPNTNKVKSWVITGDDATEELSKNLLDNWRKGEAVAFPESTEIKESDLSASGSLLPEGVGTDKEELITRTHTEWLFMVLSSKLFQVYQTELDELQEKIDAMKTYSKNMWDTMKNFWDKVQVQVNEQNLFRDHINTLKNRTNEMFAQLKKLRSDEDAQFESEANSVYQKLASRLEQLEKLIEKNIDLHKVFDQLKTLQNDFKNAKLTRDLRSKLWDAIDNAFKIVKDKRSPGANHSNNNGDNDNRLTRRIEGLKDAIDKMEKSIEKDKKDLAIQTEKIGSGDVSQLETQLREMRAKLIRERMDSKNKKLEDMYKTLQDLDNRNAKMAAKKDASEKKSEEKKSEEKVAEKTVEADEITIHIGDDHVPDENDVNEVHIDLEEMDSKEITDKQEEE